MAGKDAYFVVERRPPAFIMFNDDNDDDVNGLLFMFFFLLLSLCPTIPAPLIVNKPCRCCPDDEDNDWLEIIRISPDRTE